MTTEFKALERRLAKLETQNRRLKQTGITLFLLLSTVFVMGQVSPKFTIDAENFILRGKDGLPVAEWRTNDILNIGELRFLDNGGEWSTVVNPLSLELTNAQSIVQVMPGQVMLENRANGNWTKVEAKESFNDPVILKKTKRYTLMRLGERSYAFQGREPTTSFGSNSGFIVTSKGVVVIDTHMTEVVEKDIVKEIAAITTRPVTHVVNTHWHEDHVLGNSVYPSSVKILAHPESIKEWGNLEQPSRKPNVAVGKVQVLFRGEDRVEIDPVGRGHSEGDLAVYVPGDRVLYLGDLYVRGYVGYLAEGFLREWIAGLDRLMKLEIRFAVPGHGKVGEVAYLREYRDYLHEFCSTARAHFEKHRSIEGYSLPKKYDRYGARFFIPDNLKRLFRLWKKGELDF